MEKVWPPSGICVKVTQKLDRNGNKVCIAAHKRDSTTTYKLRLQTGSAIETLLAWMKKFTGKDSRGFGADFEIAARGGDHEGYCYVLAVTNYN